MLTDNELERIANKAKKQRTLDLIEAALNARALIHKLATSVGDKERKDIYWEAQLLSKQWNKEDDHG